MSTDDDLSPDDIFDLLSNPRRRYVLYQLAEASTPISVELLARQIASREEGIDPGAVTEDQQRRVYISLYQTHLPKLDRKGAIEYDQDERTAELTARGERLLGYLRTEQPQRRGWAYYYLAAASIAVVLLAGITLDLPPLNAVPPEVAAVVVVLATVALVVAQFLTHEGTPSPPLSDQEPTENSN